MTFPMTGGGCIKMGRGMVIFLPAMCCVLQKIKAVLFGWAHPMALASFNVPNLFSLPDAKLCCRSCNRIILPAIYLREKMCRALQWMALTENGSPREMGFGSS